MSAPNPILHMLQTAHAPNPILHMCQTWKPGVLQSMGSKKVGGNSETEQQPDYKAPPFLVGL